MYHQALVFAVTSTAISSKLDLLCTVQCHYVRNCTFICIYLDVSIPQNAYRIIESILEKEVELRGSYVGVHINPLPYCLRCCFKGLI